MTTNLHLRKLSIAVALICSACATGTQNNSARPITAGISGIVGHTLCLNASNPSGVSVTEHIEKIFGAGAVESPSDTVYTPAKPHVLEVGSDGIVGAHFALLAIEPTDVNQDMVSLLAGGDRSRTEIKIAPSSGGMHEMFKAKEGDTFVYTWRFRIAPTMKFASSFTHIHQIKAHGGAFSDPPLITFTPVANGNMEIRYVGDKFKDAATSTKLGSVKLADVMGQWLTVREEITFSNTQGRYQLKIWNQGGTEKLRIDKTELSLWRTGANHMRPKWGIYRKHDAALNQGVADAVYFANLGITRGASPSTNCQSE